MAVLPLPSLWNRALLPHKLKARRPVAAAQSVHLSGCGQSMHGPRSRRRHGESEPRSVGTRWSAHGITVLLQVASSKATQLHTKLHCKLQDWPLVSQRHFLPKGTGTFPAACLGANSLFVGCVAVLPLPSLWNRALLPHKLKARRPVAAAQSVHLSGCGQSMHGPRSRRRHGESEPRSVGTRWSAHGITVLLQVASSKATQLHTKLHCKLQDWPLVSQ